ncbi:MAG: metalloregulator ArsR/SmtB family transcription factor [bacterium]
MDPIARKRCELQAEVLKALAHPIRLAIVQHLAGEEKCVCELVGHVGTTQSNVSKHLSILKRAGIILDRKQGLSVYYRLLMPCAVSFFQCVQDIIEKQLSERSAAIL